MLTVGLDHAGDDPSGDVRGCGRHLELVAEVATPLLCQLIPIIAWVAPSRQVPPASATTARRAPSHTVSESTITPSRSNTTAWSVIDLSYRCCIVAHVAAAIPAARAASERVSSG